MEFVCLAVWTLLVTSAANPARCIAEKSSQTPDPRNARTLIQKLNDSPYSRNMAATNAALEATIATKPAQPDKEMLPLMGPNERELFRRLLSSSTSYVEFGAGGSTVLAVSLPNLKSISVVESDPAWVLNLSQRTDIGTAVKDGRLHFHMVDIGPVGKWGYPSTQRPNFPEYSTIGASAAEAQHADFVLVDGRFRVACFLKVLKHAGPGTRIAIHDYNGRPAYHAIEEFAEVLSHIDSLYVFERKFQLDTTALDDAIERFSNNPMLVISEEELNEAVPYNTSSRAL